MTTTPLYEIVIREILPDLADDGTVIPKLDVRWFATEAMTPEDAVRQWADQLADEERS